MNNSKDGMQMKVALLKGLVTSLLKECIIIISENILEFIKKNKKMICQVRNNSDLDIL